MPPESRVAVIEGRRTLITERKPPIPPTLALMLEGGREDKGRRWLPLRVIERLPLQLRGARPNCLFQEHRLTPWIEGFHTGSDGVSRFLRLAACVDCGAVCVRDASIDSMPGLHTGRHALRRRDHVIGWYTGARPRQRTYFGMAPEGATG